MSKDLDLEIIQLLIKRLDVMSETIDLNYKMIQILETRLEMLEDK